MYEEAVPLPSHLTTNCYTTEQQWLLQSPMLMQPSSMLDGLTWLQSLNIQPPLFEHPTTEEPPRRLGIYYEQLVNNILKKSRQLIDIHKNIQVFEDNRTIGEFDFLCVDQKGETHHLECAIKFYLCDGAGDQLHHYVGPNRRDRLDRKWGQLTGRQIMLGLHPAAVHTCQSLGVPTPDHCHILIQGYLFYPFADFCNGLPKAPLNPAINPQHQKGWWIRHSERERLLEGDTLRLQARLKPDWLKHWVSPEEPQDWNPVKIERPIMISRVRKHKDGFWREVDRGFVVPDQWGAPSNGR